MNSVSLYCFKLMLFSGCLYQYFPPNFLLADGRWLFLGGDLKNWVRQSDIKSLNVITPYQCPVARNPPIFQLNLFFFALSFTLLTNLTKSTDFSLRKSIHYCLKSESVGNFYNCHSISHRSKNGKIGVKNFSSLCRTLAFGATRLKRFQKMLILAFEQTVKFL